MQNRTNATLSIAEQERLARTVVLAWNATYRKGQAVDYAAYPSCPPIRTRTTSVAFALGGHTACVMVEGFRGCVAIDALEPVEE